MAPNTLGESGRGTHIHSTAPARRDQAVGLAVRQERVVGDRRKRVPQGPARRIRHRGRHGERCRLGRSPVGGLGLLQDHADIIGSRPARRLLVTRAAPCVAGSAAGERGRVLRRTGLSRWRIRRRFAGRESCWRSAPEQRGFGEPSPDTADGDDAGVNHPLSAHWISAVGVQRLACISARSRGDTVSRPQRCPPAFRRRRDPRRRSQG